MTLDFPVLPSTNVPAVGVLGALAIIGAATVSYQALHFLQFSWFYLLRPSSTRKYLHGPEPYAIVTGATDGIGKAVARELFGRGFNLIIHGRNEEKIQKVITEIKAAGGNGDVRYFVADAKRDGHDFAKLLAPFADLNITLLINNVGGNYTHGTRIDTFSEEELRDTVVWNDIFPLLLTRALLPQLRATARHGPVLAQFIGSQVATMSPATLTAYSASKAFLFALARGLDNDEQQADTPSGVRFEYLAVGSVSTASNPSDVDFTVPTPTVFAKALVDRVGCGKRAYAPFLPHAIMIWVIGLLPHKVVDYLTMQVLKKMHEADKKKRGQ